MGHQGAWSAAKEGDSSSLLQHVGQGLDAMGPGSRQVFCVVTSCSGSISVKRWNHKKKVQNEE